MYGFGNYIVYYIQYTLLAKIGLDTIYIITYLENIKRNNNFHQGKAFQLLLEFNHLVVALQMQKIKFSLSLKYILHDSEI